MLPVPPISLYFSTRCSLLQSSKVKSLHTLLIISVLLLFRRTFLSQRLFVLVDHEPNSRIHPTSFPHHPRCSYGSCVLNRSGSILPLLSLEVYGPLSTPCVKLWPLQRPFFFSPCSFESTHPSDRMFATIGLSQRYWTVSPDAFLNNLSYTFFKLNQELNLDSSHVP